MRVEQHNYIVRAWTLADSKSLALHANNVNVWNNLTDAFPSPYTEADAVAYITSVLEKPQQLDFAIEVDEQVVGGVGVFPRDNVYRLTAELGYWLSETYWGRGIMCNVIQQIASYVFDNFDIIKLFAGVFEYNTPSMRVLEKAGFTKEAILKKGAIKNNKIIDIHYYSLINNKKI